MPNYITSFYQESLLHQDCMLPKGTSLLAKVHALEVMVATKWRDETPHHQWKYVEQVHPRCLQKLLSFQDKVLLLSSGSVAHHREANNRFCFDAYPHTILQADSIIEERCLRRKQNYH